MLAGTCTQGYLSVYIPMNHEEASKCHGFQFQRIPAVKAGLYQGGYPPYGLDIVCFRAGVEVWRVVYVGQFDRWKVYPNG